MKRLPYTPPPPLQQSFEEGGLFVGGGGDLVFHCITQGHELIDLGHMQVQLVFQKF
jgi:hypothetical protein